jgi:hypothetical protein
MQFKSNVTAFFPVAAVLACVVACGTAGDSDPADPVETPSSTAPAPEVEARADNTANNPILSLDVEADHNITYYEPAPGFLIMVETNTQHQASITGKLEAPDAVQVFTKLRPTAQVPEVLLQAVMRARSFTPGAGTIREGAYQEAAPSTELIPGLPAAKDGIGTVAQAHSQANAQDFVANHGGCAWGPIFSFCRVNWAGGFHSSFQNSNTTTGVVDHFAGNGVTVRIGAGAVQPTFFQGVGTVVTYTSGFALGVASRFLEVFNAAGDQFHASNRWN